MLSVNTRFRELDPRKVGLIGMALVLVGLVLALNSGAIYRSLTSATYSAAFVEAGGLTEGSDVRIGGFPVGKVQTVKLDHGHVRVDFTVKGPGNLGALTGAAIKTATPLGNKFLAVLPSGGGRLEPGSEIPLSRTNSPYDITGILSQLTQKTEQLDAPKLATALDTAAATLKNTPGSLRTTLDGINRLSQTITGQDQQLRDLLAHADSVTGVFASRNRQLSQLFDDGNLLLAELDRRRAVIAQLLTTTTATVDQLNGLVHDNQQQLRPALQQLQGVLDLLNRDDQLIGSVVQGLNVYAGGLGDSVGGGPWYYGYIPNLPPTNLVPLLPDVLKKVGP
jgi:phospholipid/cholesterol/gamma-HCH transport system substrate-binding protein